jgi:hypothetical protein
MVTFRPVLWLIVAYGFGVGLPGTLIGAFVGPHILIPAIGHILAGAIAVYFLLRGRKNPRSH